MGCPPALCPDAGGHWQHHRQKRGRCMGTYMEVLMCARAGFYPEQSGFYPGATLPALPVPSHHLCKGETGSLFSSFHPKTRKRMLSFFQKWHSAPIPSKLWLHACRHPDTNTYICIYIARTPEALIGTSGTEVPCPHPLGRLGVIPTPLPAQAPPVSLCAAVSSLSQGRWR